jgi:hypothetical protein
VSRCSLADGEGSAARYVPSPSTAARTRSGRMHKDGDVARPTRSSHHDSCAFRLSSPLHAYAIMPSTTARVSTGTMSCSGDTLCAWCGRMARGRGQQQPLPRGSHVRTELIQRSGAGQIAILEEHSSPLTSGRCAMLSGPGAGTWIPRSARGGAYGTHLFPPRDAVPAAALIRDLVGHGRCRAGLSGGPRGPTDLLLIGSRAGLRRPETVWQPRTAAPTPDSTRSGRAGDRSQAAATHTGRAAGAGLPAAPAGERHLGGRLPRALGTAAARALDVAPVRRLSGRRGPLAAAADAVYGSRTGHTQRDFSGRSTGGYTGCGGRAWQIVIAVGRRPQLGSATGEALNP